MSYRIDKNKLRERRQNKKSDETKISDQPRIIHDGVDRTPESLIDLPSSTLYEESTNQNNFRSCSIEEIGYLKRGTKNGLSLPSSCEYSTIPWLDGSTEEELVDNDYELIRQQKQLFGYARLLTDGITNPKNDASLEREESHSKMTIIYDNKCNEQIYNEKRVAHGEMDGILPKSHIVAGSKMELKETQTKSLLNIHSQYCSIDDQKVTNDGCSRVRSSEREVQTMNAVPKEKTTMTTNRKAIDAGCEVYLGNHKFAKVSCQESVSKDVNKADLITMVATKCAGYLLDVSEGTHANEKEIDNKYINALELESINSLKDIKTLWRNKEIMRSPSLEKKLKVLERAIQQTLHHQLQLQYLAIPRRNEKMNVLEQVAVTSQSSWTKSFTSIKKKPMKKLFELRCNLTSNRAVNCMCWHKANKDVLAAGYGSRDKVGNEGGDEGGLILFWSIRNISFPEAVIKISSTVTAIDYSMNKPSLLAVGAKNGNILIFDTNAANTHNFHDPIVNSEFIDGKHQVQVMQVHWANEKSNKEERLISIALDGNILEWKIQKNLNVKTLMALKRVNTNNSVIARYASGLCFDSPTKDSQIYFVGSDDGIVYKCSYAYNDQHLDIFQNHDGPITKIRSSPFIDGVYLSSSSDWTVKLWTCDSYITENSNNLSNIAEFHSSNLFDAVHDIAWSPSCSTVFALVTGDGRIEIWDLKKSCLDPILTDLGTDKGDTLERITVLFGQADSRSHMVVTGNNEGSIEFFNIDEHCDKTRRGTAGTYSMRQNQIKMLENEISSILKNNNYL